MSDKKRQAAGKTMEIDESAHRPIIEQNMNTEMKTKMEERRSKKRNVLMILSQINEIKRNKNDAKSN